MKPFNLDEKEKYIKHLQIYLIHLNENKKTDIYYINLNI